MISNKGFEVRFLSSILCLNPLFSHIFHVTMVTGFPAILMSLFPLPFCSKLCHHGYWVSHRSSCAVMLFPPCHPFDSATTFLTFPSTCSSGETTETETLPRPTVRQTPTLTLISDYSHNSLNTSSLAGMSVEMVAMLVASIIQGQVVAVYNTEKQEACQHLDHEAPQGTSSPQNASLQETVDTALKM